MLSSGARGVAKSDGPSTSSVTMTVMEMTTPDDDVFSAGDDNGYDYS